MLDGFTLSAVTTPAALFFGEIETPIFWIAGIGLAFGVASWALIQARKARG